MASDIPDGLGSELLLATCRRVFYFFLKLPVDDDLDARLISLQPESDVKVGSVFVFEAEARLPVITRTKHR